MSIESRLREISQDIFQDGVTQQDIDRIIAAFKDEGWIPMSKLNQPRNMMSGQEFYDRFRSELDKLPIYYDDQVQILKAARKASGVDN